MKHFESLICSLYLHQIQWAQSQYAQCLVSSDKVSHNTMVTECTLNVQHCFCWFQVWENPMKKGEEKNPPAATAFLLNTLGPWATWRYLEIFLGNLLALPGAISFNYHLVFNLMFHIRSPRHVLSACGHPAEGSVKYYPTAVEYL